MPGGSATGSTGMWKKFDLSGLTCCRIRTVSAGGGRSRSFPLFVDEGDLPGVGDEAAVVAVAEVGDDHRARALGQKVGTARGRADRHERIVLSIALPLPGEVMVATARRDGGERRILRAHRLHPTAQLGGPVRQRLERIARALHPLLQLDERFLHRKNPGGYHSDPGPGSSSARAAPIVDAFWSDPTDASDESEPP